MERPYSNMLYDFEDFCDEALCFVEEAKATTFVLTEHCGLHEESHHISSALSAVERTLTALETYLKGKNESYLARIEELSKKRALAGRRPAKALSEDRGQARSEKQNSTTEDGGQQVQAAIESQRKGDPDCSCDLPNVICRLSALGQLMTGWAATRGSVELNHEEVSGTGMLLYDITEDLKDINHRLYGD